MDHLDPVDIPNPAPSSAKAKDPVCGMDVKPATARYKTLHNGKEYFFCPAGCLAKFQANPEKILSSAPKPMGSGLVSLGAPTLIMPTLTMPTLSTPAAVGTGSGTSKDRTGPDARRPDAQLAGGSKKDTRAYVCPMCPEVRQ